MKDLTQFEPKYRTLVGYLKRDNPHTLNNILTDVSARMNVSTDAIKGKSRKREIVEARHIYCNRAYVLTKNTEEEIGSFININHSTVSSGANNVETIPSLRAKYKEYFGVDSEYKPLEMLKDGEQIRTFKSINEASQVLEICHSSIRSSIRGIINSVKGFTFRYAE
jgi:hypothetical protein